MVSKVDKGNLWGWKSCEGLMPPDAKNNGMLDVGH